MKTLNYILLTILLTNFYFLSPAQDLKPEISAVKHLKELGQKSVPSLSDKIYNYNYGPFRVSVACEYCDVEALWCWHYNGRVYIWEYPEVIHYMRNFQIDNMQLLHDIQDFDQFYLPFANWFKKNLPETNEKIELLKNSTESNLEINLNSTIENLASDHDELLQAIQSLTDWNELIKKDFNTIENSKSRLKNALVTDSLHMISYSHGMRCGGDELREKWKQLPNSIKKETKEYILALDQWGISKSEISANMACIVGPMLTMLNKLNGVNDQLVAAKLSKSEAIEKIKLILSEKFWNDLTEFAKIEFG